MRKNLPQKRILIVKPSSIGDVIHSLPVLSELRANFPKSYIAWLVARKALEIIQDNPYLNEVFVFEREHWGRLRDLPRAWRELFGLIRLLRRKRFDLVIDLQGLFRSGLISWLSGAKVRVGFADGREMSHIFYTHRINCRKNQHLVKQNLALIRSLGTKEKPIEFKMVIPHKARYRVRQLIEDTGPAQGTVLVVLAPGAGWPTKRWSGKRYALLARALKEKYHARIVLVGSASEVSLIRDVERQAGFASHPEDAQHPKGKRINLAGKINLKELAALLEMADLCVAGDTGPMHLAAALNTPTVAVFGPTDPAGSGPFGQLSGVVRSNVSCSPCFSRKCKDLKCLKAVQVGDVLKRIEKIAREMKWHIS